MDAAHHRLNESEAGPATDPNAQAVDALGHRTQVVAGFWRLCLRRLRPSEPVPGQGSKLLDRAVQQLFQGLVREASEKQRQRAALGIQATGAKANREALYLDPTHRDRWEKLSRSFLERALERMQADEAPDVCELRRLAALQHFLEVDIADLYLPAHQRCSEDSYLPEPLCDVCVQLLMDVTRGVYVVQGTRYDFEVALAESGLDVEKQSLEVETLKEVFSSKVAADVRRHLTESDAGHMARRGANQLVQAVTALLTQSGLANIERACGEQVIVSGGDQELYFELKQGPPRCWDLVLSCKKTNFTSFMLNSRSDAMEVLACSPSSRIERFAVIRLMAQLQSLSVEVLEFRSEVELQNELGLPISLPHPEAEAKRISKKEGGIQTRDHPCSKAYDSFLECVRRCPDSYQKKCRTEAGKYLACMEENKSWKSQTRFTYMRFLEHFRLFTEGSGGREEGIGRFLYKDPTPRTHGVGTVMEFGRLEAGARRFPRAGSETRAGGGEKAREASQDAGTKGRGTSE
ncbi:nipblb [Symbiodinium microadriaticum]|nr:nipblb [Symbiodinium microadriaticum]